MKVKEMFPSKWLNVDDLKRAEHLVTIERIEQHEVGPRAEMKWVLFFKDRRKGMILNHSNACVIAELHGEENEAWIGKKIIIFPGRAKFRGKLVPSIVVKNVRPQD